MNRLFIRRCSMSSIEEEDEGELSDELVTQIEELSLSSYIQQKQQESPSVLEWDSELSESEQEFNDNNDNEKTHVTIQAANRALQSFIQSCSRTHQTTINDCYSPFSLQLYEEEEEEEEENSSLDISIMNTYSKSSSSFSPDNCVSELRTLEDQLQAALASLTLTINDYTLNNSNNQIEEQHSSDSSACSSGLGDEIGSESFPLYNPHMNTIKISTDDCDSAFSESGSTEKTNLTNSEQSFIYHSLINPIEETSLIIVNQNEKFFNRHEHPSKILIRTYNDDGSTKSIFIDDSMFIRDILFLLIQKNHREPDINYALIEILPDLHMERIFEDHQKLTEAILMWPTVTSNRLGFSKRVEKYNFLRTMNSYEQFFTTPNIEGNIYLKEKSRKSWKKYFCVLRSSGLYFIPKGKNKKDLVCLANFENVELFFGLDWKRKFKSPSDFCFALKHPLIQKKSSKYIKYMCVETKHEFDRWIRNIRIAKFGQQLKINYVMMDQAMNIYHSSNRFTDQTEKHNDDSISDRRTPIPSNQYYSIHSNDDQQLENCQIKSASYMDELRQRLERVLNDPLPSTIRSPILMPPPPKLKPIKSSYVNSIDDLYQIKKPNVIIGSTPLPRKQMDNYGNLSYRTINHQHSHQMSKSFVIPTKQDDQHNGSLLSMTSKSDSLNLDETISPPPPSTFFLNSSKFKINNKNSSNNSKQSILPLKKSLTSFRTNLSSNNRLTSISLNQQTVPPVPPRKSSIPRPIIKPQPPQRNSSTHLFLRKSHL